jgi:hypothetical protein
MELEIPLGVVEKKYILGAVLSLKFVDHGLSDEKKFPDLSPNKI